MADDVITLTGGECITNLTGVCNPEMDDEGVLHIRYKANQNAEWADVLLATCPAGYDWKANLRVNITQTATV